MKNPIQASSLLALALLSLPLSAAPSGDPIEGEESHTKALDAFFDTLSQGEAWVKLRYRYEFVDQDSFSPEAHASTLRTVVGYETPDYHGLRGLIEFEDVTAIGNDDLYNSTVNGATSRPVVADPEDTEVNQVYVRYEGVEDVELFLGRRRIILDNHRFVGNVGWRQNEQTFDAAGFDWEPIENGRVFYSYFHNANRIFSNESSVGDAPMDSHILNASYDFEDIGEAVVYWYYLDVRSPGVLDGFSTSTVGARFSGSQSFDQLDVLYTGEFADQSDTGDNPNDVDASYWFGELGVKAKGVTAKVGYEVLEGSGDVGDKFTTPLATLHKFNGWADKFLGTPDTGLEDLYLGLSGSWEELKWALVWHDFQAESGSMDYGTELDASLGYPVSKHTTAGLKLASYDADDFSDDTTKLWFWLSVAL